MDIITCSLFVSIDCILMRSNYFKNAILYHYVYELFKFHKFYKNCV